MLRLVRAHNGSAGRIQILWMSFRAFQPQHILLPFLPATDVFLARVVEALEDASAGTVAGVELIAAKRDCDDEFTIVSRELDFARERDVPVAGAVIAAFHALMLRNFVPSVGRADIADRSLFPWRRAIEGDRNAG